MQPSASTGTSVMPAAPALDRAQIARLVDAFYDRVQADPVLGPIFNPAVHDWPAHKATLVEFWSSVMLGTRSYRGNPMAAHFNRGIEDWHFAHWLGLWREVATTELGEAKAAALYAQAQKIAGSLRYGLGFDHQRTRRVGLAMHPGEK